MDADVLRPATDFEIARYHVDLSAGSVRYESARCEDLEDALGGAARAVKYLDGTMVDDPFAPESPIVMNLGLLTGTRVMTGLRTFFTGYSPLKSSRSGGPGLMWSTGSGHFGSKIKGLGIDEVVFTGRSAGPIMIHLSPADDPDGPSGPAHFEFLDATDLLGVEVNPKIQELHRRYPGAHFAILGPAGEHPGTVRYAAIALSTDNQLKTGDPKPRFCGRGGFGSVLGSKNLMGIIADGPNPDVSGRGLKEVNKEINLGPGSLPFRDAGTWRQMTMQHEVGSLPEFNFNPQGDDRAVALQRSTFEAGPHVVKPESCWLCGIKCHKNVYEPGIDGEMGEFRAKVDYEPLALLSTNLGVYDPDLALDLIALADELAMDSISLGVTLGYAMEWNRRHPDRQIAGGLSFGDHVGVAAAMRAIAGGEMPELGQGTLRLAMEMGETEYAMQSKGLEFPAYMPHSNPGYPWAPSGGHMTMRTFLLLIIERETGLDYWVDAITNRGPQYIVPDLNGTCKFVGVGHDVHAAAMRAAAGLDVDEQQIEGAVDRTFVRVYANERRQGFDESDYSLPAEAHQPLESSTLPYFNTPEFFGELRSRVMETLDERARSLGLMA